MRFPAFSVLLLATIAVALVPAPVRATPTLLFDSATGKVLYSEDADQLWYPASLTKIMTAYVTFDALKQGKITFETKLVSTENAAKEPPSKIGIPIGGEIGMELGLRSLIIKSANDVAVMLAEAVSGSEAAFVERMNETARRLGMSRTRFVNPNGLPVPGQVTTARDLGRLATAVLRDFPQYAHYWAMPHVQVGKRRLRSHNSLLRKFEGADGIKTGFICDSGFNIVASATREGHKLIAVVLGSPTPRDRGARAASLLEHGFQTHSWKLFFSPVTLESLPVGTTSSEVVSIREQACGRGRARVSARARRRLLLRRKRRAAAKKASNAGSQTQQTASGNRAIAAPKP